MAIVETTQAFGSGKRLLSCADVAVLPTQLPTGQVDYELDRGRLVVMSPMGRPHGRMQGRIATELTIQGERRGLGEALVEVGVILWRNPDRLVGPDAAFIAQKSLPARCSPEGYLETIPELVVEVRSKNDTQPEIALKVEDYLTAGVEMVWVIDPENRTVGVHRREISTEILTERDILTAEPIIPGFRLELAQLFI